MDDLDGELTRIDSSGTDDEFLVRLLSGNVVPRRSTMEGAQGGSRFWRSRLFFFPSMMGVHWRQRFPRSSEFPIASIVHGSFRGIRVCYGSPRSHLQCRIQEVRWEFTENSVSGMVATRHVQRFWGKLRIHDALGQGESLHCANQTLECECGPQICGKNSRATIWTSIQDEAATHAFQYALST